MSFIQRRTRCSFTRNLKELKDADAEIKVKTSGLVPTEV